MKVVLNAVSAKMGGAVAYMRNFLPTLSRADGTNDYVVFLQENLAADFAALAPNIRVETDRRAQGGALARLVFDQWTLRRFCRTEKADCLFSTANFAVLGPPVKQVLAVRNPVYFSRDYYRHVRDVEGYRGTLRVAARRRMVALSAGSSDVVVTPSAAMRDMLLDWGAADPAKCRVIPHGFDRESFLAMTGDADESVEKPLERRGDEVLLLYPSLYGKHKNFDVLMEGLAQLVRRGLNVRLILTCRIEAAGDAYQRRTWSIIQRHDIENRVTMLGRRPYKYMPRIYRGADVVVWPTIAESFGHPLLEAMASRRPIVSSDLPVNREMARDAALYFEKESARDFADKVEAALGSDTASALVSEGQARVADFSWRDHVAAFVDVFKELAEGQNG